MTPFGSQIVIYLFLAGVAAGAAFFGSVAMSMGKAGPFSGGRRAIAIAFVCALAGSLFLILDLTKPGEFLLILTSANAGSAISWGARILVVFILAAAFLLIATRGWGQEQVERGFKGGDLVGLWVLRLAALGLAIYPFFVLRQGEAYPLWQNRFLLWVIAFSAFHAGLAAFLLVSGNADCRSRNRPTEIGLGIAVAVALVLVFALEGATPLVWAVALAAGTLVPLLLAITKPQSSLPVRVALVLVGTFVIRHWIINAGQLA